MHDLPPDPAPIDPTAHFRAAAQDLDFEQQQEALESSCAAEPGAGHDAPARKPPYNPLRVGRADHPDLALGIVWSDCELEWIRAYGHRCYNHGIADGLESGRLLFDRNIDAVTHEMVRAAQDVMLQHGVFMLSTKLLTRIYRAMAAKRSPSGDSATPRTTP